MMDYKDYQIAVKRTQNNSDKALNNYILGLVGECGELCNLIKKQKYHGHEYTRMDTADEFGDIFWYASAVSNELGICVITNNNNPYVGIIDIEELSLELAHLSVTLNFVLKQCKPMPPLPGNLRVASLQLHHIFLVLEQLCFVLPMRIDEVLKRNIDKLKKRYPDGFSQERSINRVEAT